MTEVAPRISVVVPAYQAAASIECCLTALARQTLPRDQYEVIVVDDGSTDDTATRARRGGARVLRLERNQGPACARNVGLAAARGDIVVFTDADCEPTPRFLASLTSPLEDGSVAATRGTYLSSQQALVARFVQLEYESRYRHAMAQPSIDFIDTCAACYRRADLVRMGGFDPRLRVCEDQELSFRLAEAGLRMRFMPDARTYHHHADTLPGYVRKKFHIGRWKAAVLRTHPRRALHDSHTPQALKVQVASAYALCVTATAVALHPESRRTWPVLALTVGVYAALSADFVLRSARRDLSVAIAAPSILLLRDLALGAGLVMGFLLPAGSRSSSNRDERCT